MEKNKKLNTKTTKTNQKTVKKETVKQPIEAPKTVVEPNENTTPKKHFNKSNVIKVAILFALECLLLILVCVFSHKYNFADCSSKTIEWIGSFIISFTIIIALALLIILMYAFANICKLLASKKGYTSAAYFWFGFFFAPITMLYIACLPDKILHDKIDKLLNK